MKQNSQIFIVKIFSILSLLTLSSQMNSHAQTPFTCDGSLFVSQADNTSSPTILSNYNTTNNPITLDTIGVASSSPLLIYNALGYNVQDNFIYGLEQKTNNLVKIGADGIGVVLGPVTDLPIPGIPALDNYVAGDMDTSGFYYTFKSDGTNLFRKINITTQTQVDTFPMLLGGVPTTINIGDIAFNPIDGKFYGLNQANQNLYSIDISGGTDAIVTIVGNTGLPATSANFGAVFMSNTGEFYGLKNQTRTLYKIDLTLGNLNNAFEMGSIGGSVTLNDGAHCVNSPITFGADLSVTKTDGIDVYTAGTTTTYTIVATNNDIYRGVFGAIVTDALPSGIVATDFSYTAVSSTGSQTKVIGTQTGAINDTVNLAAGGTVTYTVTVTIPLSYTGSLVNTVVITPPTNIIDTDTTNNTATDTDTPDLVSISGNVWNDGNGDATNSGEPNITSGVWVNLVDPNTNEVIASVEVDASGNYIFNGLTPSTDYNIILTDAVQTVGTVLTTSTLPTGYISTGVNLDGTPNTTNTTSVISLNTGTIGVTNQSFGIEQLPESDDKSQIITKPLGNSIPEGAITTDVSGNDPEDGVLGNTNTIVITGLPTNATLLYNGIPVTVGQIIIGFDPSLLSFTDITLGSTSIAYPYSFVDAANVQDPTPAIYTVSWVGPLPVSLGSFGVTEGTNCSVNIKWVTLSEQNLNKFEVEQSVDGKNYSSLLEANASNLSNGTTYEYNSISVENNISFFRLKTIENGGIITFSNVVSYRNNCIKSIVMSPNPVKNELTIAGIETGNTITILSAIGVKMQVVRAKSSTQVVELGGYVRGTYIVIIADAKGKVLDTQKVVKQ